MRSVQINIHVILPIVFYIVLWQLTLNGIVSCQKATQNATVPARATRTEPGAAMQAFMSKMMSDSLVTLTSVLGYSLIPANATEDLFGELGNSTGPNLGYEPYWTDVTDMEWEDRCKRCTKVFEKYEVVCAVDDTGDMYVNISLCGMMWQNCLAGNAKGIINSTEATIYKDYYVVADGWARFSARIQDHLTILLSSTASLTPPYYEISLDDDYGYSSLMRDRSGHWLDYFKKQGITAVTTLEFTEFIIRWNKTSGWILMTKSSYTNWTHGFYLNCTDPNPFNIRYISFRGRHEGPWIVNGFTVESLGPCADINTSGLAHTLPTNPTAIPVIDKMYSAYNRDYYTRMSSAGLDPDIKAFGTREEY